ncbi:hypothetical protein [Paraburkholderia saeva]|uniref:Uncharacterized protein n=1 Tax=Paraburkholderia saeva TaxID=2777537 RepID=A0A9N8X3L8_9BURK|nr:hypothetical protein [Paraburkholderia saeva]CAG4903130.1 hypothetical protein LMG31841_03191 [Paraburkholderia saeva]CAG4926207.1 hypothetical protein R70241_05449 [Paraburkholderia saeva]
MPATITRFKSRSQPRVVRRVSVTLAGEHRERIEAAAKRLGVSAQDFMRYAASKFAERFEDERAV